MPFGVSRENFLSNLMNRYGVLEKQEWSNNNGTVSNKNAYVYDVKDMKDVADVISEIYAYNKESKQPPIVAVPVAGWAAEDPGDFSFLTEKSRKERLVYEYAKSYSLSPFTTGQNADLILRISKQAQKMEVVTGSKGEYLLKITPGCRTTDIEQELAKMGLALRPHMTTLHVASWVGTAANNGYGPGKNYKSMTADIVEMKVISPQGEHLTLSATENPHLFAVLRDCHMGAGFFVTELTIKNIEPNFLLKRTDNLLKDANELQTALQEKKLLDKEHFIMHYMPVGMNAKNEDHFSRFRISTFDRTIEAPTKATHTSEHQDVVDWINLEETSSGEPLINLIVRSKRLQKYFDIVLEAAARNTFGNEKEKVQIGYSADVIHLLKTYTESPLTDVNWLIQVPDADGAKDLLIKLMSEIEKKLEVLAKDHQYPLLTIYSRFLKGLYYPEGQGGVAATAVDQKGHKILSFELLSYPELQKTDGFKEIQDFVIQFLETNHFKYKYHPGKTWPNNINSLTKIFNDEIDKKRLANFQNAIIELHGGKDNLEYSPFLTPQKKYFVGLSSEEPSVTKPEKVAKPKSPQMKEAFVSISNIADRIGVQDSKPLIHRITKVS